MRSLSRCLFLLSAVVLTVVLVAPVVTADWGCFNCVPDYDDCQFPAGVCSNKCEQVGHNEQGDATRCTQVEVWPGPGGKECAMSGGACDNTVVNGNEDPPGEGNWCPDGEPCS